MSDDDKKDEQKTERFNMFMSPSELKAIEDWAWEKRIRSKSEAVRRLCQIALTLEGNSDGIKKALEKFAEKAEQFRSIIDAWEDEAEKAGVPNDEVEKAVAHATSAYSSIFTGLMHFAEALDLAAYFKIDHELETVIKDAEKAKKRMLRRMDRHTKDLEEK